MDPLSIAASAAGIGATCYSVATAIRDYVGEVKDVDNVISQFGNDMKTLSTALNNVHGALTKHESSLSTNLSDEFNLYSSLGACIQDCGDTVDRIIDLLAESKTHGRSGRTMGRIATHWKYKEKTKELTLLRGKVISFHTAMNMNLQMIHVCLFLQVQEGNETKQEDVMDGITQLRRQIKKLTRLAQRQNDDMESLPSTVLQSLDVAIALDTSASTRVDDTRSGIFSDQTQEPNDKVRRWVQNSHLWESPLSNPDIVEVVAISDSEGSQVNSSHEYQMPSSNSIVEVFETNLLRLSGSEKYSERLSKLPSYLQNENIEPAKSICRKVIHGTEFEFGINHPTYKEAVTILALIYEHAGDDYEASQLRKLLDVPGIGGIRREFKALVKDSSPTACMNYALSWTRLLYDNSKLNRYKRFLSKIHFDQRSPDSNSGLLVALSILGNSVLAQIMLARGVSISQPVAIDSEEFDKGDVTPLECAIFFGHLNLVRIYLEANSDDSWIKDRGESWLNYALHRRDTHLIRILFDHMPKDCGARDSTKFTTEMVENAFNRKDYEAMALLFANVPKYHRIPNFSRELLEKACQTLDKTAILIILKDARMPDGLSLLSYAGLTHILPSLDSETAELIFENKSAINLSTNSGWLLSEAVSCGNIQVFELLLKKCPVSKWKDNSIPFQLAIRSRKVEIIHMLLKYGATSTTQLVQIAIAIRWKKGLELLISTKNDPLVNEATVRLLFNRSKIDVSSEEVTEEERPEVIDYLLSMNPLLLDVALFFAINEEDTAGLELVLRHKPNIHGPLKHGSYSQLYPLHVAVDRNHCEMVEILLRAGANVYSIDEHGRNAMYYALKYKGKSETEFEDSLEIIKMLKKAGATYKENVWWTLSSRGRRVSATLHTWHLST